MSQGGNAAPAELFSPQGLVLYQQIQQLSDFQPGGMRALAHLASARLSDHSLSSSWRQNKYSCDWDSATNTWVFLRRGGVKPWMAPSCVVPFTVSERGIDRRPEVASEPEVMCARVRECPHTHACVGFMSHGDKCQRRATLTGSITGALMRRDKPCQNTRAALSSSRSHIGKKCKK